MPPIPADVVLHVSGQVSAAFAKHRLHRPPQQPEYEEAMETPATKEWCRVEHTLKQGVCRCTPPYHRAHIGVEMRGTTTMTITIDDISV